MDIKDLVIYRNLEHQELFRDIAHPITTGARRQLEDAILSAYADHMAAQAAARQLEEARENSQDSEPQAEE